MPSRILARAWSHFLRRTGAHFAGKCSTLAAAAVTLGLLTGAAAAQDKWPSKPVTVIVPFAAGGNTDVMARIFADQMTKRLGQQFVVENRPGAGGVNGLHAMTRATPDGYTIAVATSGGIAINPVLIKEKIPYNVEKDFTYLYGMAAQPNIWLVHPSVPANTMAELIAWLKANPETPYATSGPGTTQHICGEMLADAAGLKMTPVSYRASNLSIQDLIGGQIKLACDNFAVAYEQVKAGKLRAVSITSPGPYPLAKEIAPTAATVPGFELMPAFGWVGPANMPPDIVKKLTEELVAAGKIPEVRAALEKFGVLQTELPGPAYADALKKERAGYARVIEKAGIKVP
jgi:tripartite-type tricarboxylate transporter receptor subunit TctC